MGIIADGKGGSLYMQLEDGLDKFGNGMENEIETEKYDGNPLKDLVFTLKTLPDDCPKLKTSTGKDATNDDNKLFFL